MTKEHFGDPCVSCGTPHDDVAVGECPGPEGYDPEALDVAAHVIKRVLGTVLYSLAVSQSEDETLGDAILRLNRALRDEYQLENRDLLAIAAGDALRRMDAER